MVEDGDEEKKQESFESNVLGRREVNPLQGNLTWEYRGM